MRQLTVTMTAILALLLATAPGFAAVEFEPGIALVDTAGLKAMMDAGEEMLLINTLSPIEIRDKSIPGSVGMPYEFIKDGKTNLPADKGVKLVFYCKGPK
ncbi:MAG: hypothetical protein P1S46_11670 [bacterium]|nr:hypothetical protein [bacterium]MDT8285061.1 hypothetical protein [Thermovirgaceae bacterium]